MSAATERRQPYPGLRPFRREETDLFFGREGCVNALVDLLATKHFLAVLGPSGSGKSSLVRTGLLDALELGLMRKAGSRWRIVDFRPGGQPIANLASALLKIEGNASPKDAALLRAFLSRGPRSVIEWCRDGHLVPRENLLLLVDQFEELFRYQEYEGREEAEAFVALLLECSASRDLPIYVTITMRSEFLGACALIEKLAERMNDGQFLTPRMIREQCRAAIEGPAAVCGIGIEPALVNRLLNDLANFAPWEKTDSGESWNQLDRLARRADQLPLLQHVLNRIWIRAVEASSPAPARGASDKVVLRLTDYETIGGIQGALDRHADEILSTLGSDHRPMAERIFRALTSGSTAADAIRHPTRFKELVTICDNNEAAAREVVEAFRAPGRNFLLPEDNVPINQETMVDISHESLIRQWRQFSAWLERETQDAQQWRRLVDAAELERRKQGELLRDLNLQTLLEWRESSKPSAGWARRYGEPGEYPQAMAFLDRSRDTARAQRRRGLMVGASVLVCVLVAGGVGYKFQSIQEKYERKTTEFIEGRQREAEQEIYKKVKTTVANRNLTVADIKPIYDDAIDRLLWADPRGAVDRDAAIQRIIGVFKVVYANDLIGAALTGKPFYVFDVIGQYFDQDKIWRNIIGTLGDIGSSYIDAEKLDLARMAFEQALETARKRDASLFRFKEELNQVVSGATTSLRNEHLTPLESKIRIYDFFLTMLRTLDRSDTDTTTKQTIAQTLEDEG
jgi:hypothetical protein